MIKLISVLLQFMMLKKTFRKTTSSFEFVEQASKKAQGYFMFSLGLFGAALFLLIALIVGVIGIGLQLEQQGGISFSGLMVSATIFLVISLMLFGLSLVLLIVERQRQLEQQREKERQQAAAGSPLAPLLEEILKQILENLAKPKEPKSNKQNSSSRSSEPAT